MLRTAFTARFGVAHPIVQAGMAHEAGAALASAVSNAGGLGTIGTIGGTPERARTELAACRGATTRPFAVNVVTWPWAPWSDAILDVVLAEPPPVVTLSFGEPAARVARCRAAGCRVIVQAQDVAGARAALAAGADAIIAQGNEAGGHTGRRGTLAFAAQVLELAGDVPVLVAGGIGSGRGVAAALAMGAAGAVLGTRFKASDEFACDSRLKDAVVASDGGDTLYDEIADDACGLDWPNGVTGRVLRNRFTQEWEGRREALRAKTATYPPFGHLVELDQSPETAINWAGESAGLVAGVRPAADIVADVVADAERLLRAATRVLGA
jgi:nitronate monooxygenase